MKIKIAAFGSLFPTAKTTSKVQLKYGAKKEMFVIKRADSESPSRHCCFSWLQTTNKFENGDFEK